MARTFDLSGDGEQPPEGTGFDTPNGTIGDTGSVDSGGGDAFGGTTLGDDRTDPRGGDFVFDANAHIGRDKTNRDGSYRRKRKRKYGIGGGPSPQRSKADLSASIDGLSKTLMVMHIGLAEMTKTPELVLQETESSALAISVANVLSEFDITPDPKMQAIVGLMMTAGMIYGPRMYNIRERLKNTDARPKGKVHHLRPVDNNSQVVEEPFAQ